MQRYHAGGCASAVNNSTISGIQARDVSRSDSSALPPNFSLNSRRVSQITQYKLRCEKEQLNSRLGPPDFHPASSDCPEEILTREYAQSGYRETVEGLEEAREISLSQVQAFTKPITLKCKEAIRKCHRAINESRAQKRKAGQVYGVPISGTLLTNPGIFPEQRPCGEDFRRKWIEGLSQLHKRLRSLADQVPHGYRKNSLFEVLIRNNVPLLRATWYIKVTYLNQVRPNSSNSSSRLHEKTQSSRSEQWTKDVIDYLKCLLNEFIARNNSHSTFHIRERSSQTVYAGSVHQKSNSFSAFMDGDGPSLYTKWWYVVRIIHWHHAEGLLVPSLIIDWILNQLQEKESLCVIQLLLPIMYGVIETVVLSQTYVRSLVGIALRFSQEPSPGGSDLVDNSRRAYTTSAVVEMLRYLILAVPDTFVALDCFPLPKCVVSHVVNDGSFLTKMAEDARKVMDGQLEVAGAFRDKIHEFHTESSFNCVVSSIQKRAETLSRAARPKNPGHNVAKALHALDLALIHGDITVAYKLLFENLWDGVCSEHWIAEVSPCLYSSLNQIGKVTSSVLCSVFFIFEWATCEFRNFRNVPPRGLKFTGRRDFSHILIAARLLKLKMSNMPNLYSSKRKREAMSDTFGCPSPLHDVIVCWIDQHEVHNGEGFKRLQLLIGDLIRAGIFNPQAYVRQLTVSGIMDGNGHMVDSERQKRHYKLLKHLPVSYVCDALGEAHSSEPLTLMEAANVYSSERRMLLQGLSECSKSTPGANSSTKKLKRHRNSGFGTAPFSVDQRYSQMATNFPPTDVGTKKLSELKASISVLLQFPLYSSLDSEVDESQGWIKRAGVVYNRKDVDEESSRCEECRMAKRQKLSDEGISIMLFNPADEEELWWDKKVLNIESFKAEPPKPTKQTSKGRPKSVRKTQSLAQLATARIEGSQGASTSHICESRIGCPHHRSGFDDVTKNINGFGNSPNGNIVSIGKILKTMRFSDKRTMAVWLISTVKQHIEEGEKLAAQIGQYNRPLPAVDDQNSTRWRLGEDELSSILYILDGCDELVSATKFLLWLLQKVPSSPGSVMHIRNNLILPRIVENHAYELGETFLLSAIRRYENIFIAADLIPGVLSATMCRTAAVLESNSRPSGSPVFVYACYLLRKYSNVASVVEWEKAFKSSCDKRLSSELESGKSLEGFPVGAPNGVEDVDDYFHQKISGVRVSRVGLNMKDIIHRHIDEVFQYFFGKDRKPFGPGMSKNYSMEKLEDSRQVAYQIVMGLMDCMRQTGGAAQEGDPSLVSSAIGAIVNSVGHAIAIIPDVTPTSNNLNVPSPSDSLQFARHILRIHLTCLCILKEALGERQSRVFEVALAAEASAALMQAFAPGKAPRNQFQVSPDSHFSNSNLPNDTLNNSNIAVLGRTARIKAAVSAFVVGAILQGVSSLERMVTLFKLKEGLDLIQFARSLKSNMNGSARSSGVLKMDNLVEISVNWFRVLVGNCRTISDGFIVDLLGEPSIVALHRMQRALSLNLAFPPAYSIFAFVIWRPIIDASIGVREDFHQLLTVTMCDTIKHLPFREICLRDTHGLYDLIAEDNLDSEFLTVLESSGSNLNWKAAAMVPLRGRLFLDSILDCKTPPVVKLDERKWVPGQSELRKQCGENAKKLIGKLVNVLDTLQPARFHWQWVELRLLLNEQAVNEKMMENDVSLAEAIRSLSPNTDKSTSSEIESNFIQIILTRLLVRPDAAPLFSELVNLLGKSLEDSMLSQAKWLLRGAEVLYGKKSIRQKIINFAAELKELSLKPQHWKPWGWCHFDFISPTPTSNKRDKRKSVSVALEEGEVVDEGTEFNQLRKGTGLFDVEGFIVSQQHVTERALIELILPCLDRGSNELRNNFASEMIKQMSNIEQQINTVTRGVGKPAASPSPIVGSPVGKGSNRKSAKSGSPGISRQSAGSADTVPPSPAALRASMTLRLQFLLRLIPNICSDRDPSARNMRYTLALVILRLLGSRVVHEDASYFVNPVFISSKRDVESLVGTSNASALLCGETLFDCLLLVLHVLLSSHQPSWLKSESKSTDYAVFDRDLAESLQNDLDRMELPEKIRMRIQTAMPILFQSVKYSVSCLPPSVPSTSIACLQPSYPVTSLSSKNINPTHRNQLLPGQALMNLKTKPPTSQLDLEMDLDPWTLLEDGAGSSQLSTNSTSIGTTSEQVNLKASSFLKGAVRVRRADLGYIGTIDEDS